MSKVDVIAFDTVSAMVADTTIPNGKLVQTRGYSQQGIGANLYRYDATSTATADGGFVINATGAGGGRFIAVDQTVADVTKFGAVPGGAAAGNTAAIQAAVNAALEASAQASFTVLTDTQSTTVYFPAGTYDINATITIGGSGGDHFSGITFKGEGKHRSVLRAAAGTSDSTMPSMLDFTPVDPGTVDANNNWTLIDMGFEGVNPWTSASITGVNARKSAYFTIERCFFRYFDKAIEMRNWSNQVVRSRFEFCTTGVYFSELDGIDGQTTINDNVISFSSFGTCNYGIVTARSLPINMLSVTNNQFDGNSNAAILFNGPIEHYSIDSNYFELQGRGGAATIETNNSGGTTTVQGAIVMHPTTNNVSGANGTINDNFFINCNTTNIVSASGVRQMTATGNRIGGSGVTNFVKFENASGISLGPLPYTTTQRILIEQSRRNSSGTVILTKVVDITNSNVEGNTHIVSRDVSGFQPPRFAINDLSRATKTGVADLVVNTSAIGIKEIAHASANGSLSYTFTLPVTPNSPLSGALLRFCGQAMGDDGSGQFQAVVVDNSVTTTMNISASFSAGAWSSCRNNTYYVAPQASGSRNITIEIKAVGAATNQYLRGFAIADAAYELNAEPYLQ